MSSSLREAATSIADTEPERPLATYSFRPSGVMAMFHGRFPTGIRATGLRVAASMTSRGGRH